MENEKEHKPTVDETIENFFDKSAATDGEQQPESSPVTEQAENQPVDESDSAKTQSKEDVASFKGVDKGFANHPKWIEREQKLKETEAKLRELEQSSSSFSKLLDDPLVYKKYLQSQGFSEEQISQSMAQRGFREESQGINKLDRQSNDIAENICKKLGWDISRLNDQQKGYIRDQIDLVKAVYDDVISSTIENRLKPIESHLHMVNAQEKTRQEYEKAKAEAKDEFPELDWEKDIEPAMARYLDELDKKDPKRTIPIDAFTLYEKATRQLLKEKRITEARQEERDKLKKNARPLTARNPIQNASGNLKGKTALETLENAMEALGVKE